jgi:hypothetical protein
MFVYFRGGGGRLSPLGMLGITALLYQPRMMMDECGAVGGISGKGNRSTRRKPAQCRFVHHKSHMA